MNKYKTIILVIILVIVSFIFIKSTSFQNKKTELPSVSLKEFDHNNSFAIMVEDDGDYIEIDSTTWPDPEEYVYNSTLSGCMDSKGILIPNSLVFNSTTNKVDVTVDKTSNCYLYFDLESR